MRKEKLDEFRIPELIGFEHHLDDEDIIDTSFYFSSEQINQIISANSSLSSLESSLLGAIELLNKKAGVNIHNLTNLNGIWIETDQLIDRTQIYLNIFPSLLDELYCIPRKINISNLNICPSTPISHIGYVVINQEICGFKLLHNISLSESLTQEQLCIAPFASEAMHKLNQPQLQAGHSFLGDSYYESSLEVDCCKASRFTSQDNWVNLFESPLFRSKNWELSKEQVLNQYAYRKYTNLVQVSGINHVKFALKNSSRRIRAKIYSGIITTCQPTSNEAVKY